MEVDHDPESPLHPLQAQLARRYIPSAPGGRRAAARPPGSGGGPRGRRHPARCGSGSLDAPHPPATRRAPHAHSHPVDGPVRASRTAVATRESRHPGSRPPCQRQWEQSLLMLNHHANGGRSSLLSTHACLNGGRSSRFCTQWIPFPDRRTVGGVVPRPHVVWWIRCRDEYSRRRNS